MSVLVLQGSPNVGGSTAMLAGEFARGAREAGHSAEVVIGRFGGDVEGMEAWV